MEDKKLTTYREIYKITIDGLTEIHKAAINFLGVPETPAQFSSDVNNVLSNVGSKISSVVAFSPPPPYIPPRLPPPQLTKISDVEVNTDALNTDAPNTDAPNKAAPNKVASNKVASNKVASNKVAPNKVAPNKVAPQNNGQLNDDICVYCKKVGHWISECREIPEEYKSLCFKCWSSEHKVTNCKSATRLPPPWKNKTTILGFFRKT